MKICSKIKNRNGSSRNIHVNGTLYVFAPYKDNDGNEHLVADVTNDEHAAIFSASEHYYPLDKKKEKQSTLKRGDNGEKTDPPPPPPASSFSDEIRAEAAQLLQGSSPVIGQEIAKVSSMDVVSCAIELEEAGENRKAVLKLLTSTLEYSRQSGQA